MAAGALVKRVWDNSRLDKRAPIAYNYMEVK